MKDIMGLMKKAKDMQAKMQEMQSELENAEVEGVSGGDMVRVVLTGKGNMKEISIDPSMAGEDQMEILEDLIVTAHNEARRKLEEFTAQKTQEMTADLGLPAGMNLPT